MPWSRFVATTTTIANVIIAIIISSCFGPLPAKAPPAKPACEGPSRHVRPAASGEESSGR